MRYEVGTRLYYIDGILPPIIGTIVEKFAGNKDVVRDRKILIDGTDTPVEISIDNLWFGEKIANNVHRCRNLLRNIRLQDDKRHLADGGEFGIDEEFWCEKIRYWEDRKPSRVKIVAVYSKKYADHERWIYAHSDEYGHPVYVERSRCFYIKSNAVRTSRIRTIEHDLRQESDISFIMTLSRRS